MKKALEAHWSGAITAAELLRVAADVEAAAWRAQTEAGIDLIGLDGTLYDQVLDATFQLGLIPPRFKVRGGLGVHGDCLWLARLFETSTRRRPLPHASAPQPGCSDSPWQPSMFSILHSQPSDHQALDLPAPAADSAADPYAPGGGLPLYFALARGAEGAPALDMSK